MDAERLQYLLNHDSWTIEDCTWLENIFQNSPEEIYWKLGELLKEDKENAAGVPEHVSERLKKSLLKYINKENNNKTADSVPLKDKNEYDAEMPNDGKQSSRKINMKIRRLKRLIAAAALILILIGTAIMTNNFISNKNIKLNTINQSEKIALPENDTIFNLSDDKRTVFLSDSTKVELMQKSYLYFKRQFSTDKKIVCLNGSAVFTVKKEIGRPFSVYTESTEIRDLGTIFFVKNNERILDVKLLKGKVLLHSFKNIKYPKDIIMKPGQVFDMNKNTGEYRLFYPEDTKLLKDANQRLEKENKINSMSFVNASVRDVLDAVANKYKLQINYSASDLKNKSFTGDLSNLPTPEQILRIICTSNNLQYQIKGDTVLIH